MKRIICGIVLLAVTAAALFAQNVRLPRLAVVTFSVNTDKQKAREDAIAIRNFVQSNMVSSGKYDVITRDEIDKLLENQRIQVSSISSSENIKKLQLQNISYIVTGTVDALDNDYGVTISILDVSTGRFTHSTSQFMSNTSADIYNKTAMLVRNFQQGLSNEGENVVQSGRSGSYGNYNLGDIGPAGGLIFYDKGTISDGWRYLEAAPDNKEFSSSWYNAFDICKNLKVNNISGWRLPTKDELRLMHSNLKRKNLGNFSETSYWSDEHYLSGQAISFNFGGGTKISYKNDIFLVRAVRAF